ncbi:DUF6575 domain-containing protein [Candidatus Ferrigenium straubiae]|jgi:hypothetical protein|uniref:DUF6575 domain-containing protein n=1 Tax=Candidatus Ferrigenium straubiae TaxID=2919506 RepID=UPI003F4ACD4E
MPQHNIENVIKELVPWEVLDYYDGPKLYSCKDNVGQIYLVYWLDGVRELNSWLYLRVSPARYLALKNAHISISKALSEPEEGFAYEVKFSPTQFDIALLKQSQIKPEWLPEADDFLDLPSSTLPAKISTALEQAKATNRQVFDVALGRISNQYEIGCGKLGKILEAVQNAVNAFACASNRELKRIPEEVKFKNELLFTTVFASSIGIRLQSKSGELVSNDEGVQAAKILAELLRDTDVPECIPERLKSFNVLARSRFKHLLHVLVDSEVSLSTDWSSPFGSEVSSRISFDKLKRTLQKLEETDDAMTQIRTYSGKLVGVDIESDFFAMIPNDGQLIKGKLSKQLEGGHFEVPSMITAIVQEVCVVDPLTEREKWTYTLFEVSSNQS